MAGLLSAEDKTLSLRREWQAKDAAAKTMAEKNAAMIWYIDKLRLLGSPLTGIAPGFEDVPVQAPPPPPPPPPAPPVMPPYAGAAAGPVTGRAPGFEDVLVQAAASPATRASPYVAPQYPAEDYEGYPVTSSVPYEPARYPAEDYEGVRVMPPITVQAGLLSPAARPPQGGGEAAYVQPPAQQVGPPAAPPLPVRPVTSPLGGYGYNPQGANVQGAGLSSNSAADDYIAYLRWQAGMR